MKRRSSFSVDNEKVIAVGAIRSFTPFRMTEKGSALDDRRCERKKGAAKPYFGFAAPLITGDKWRTDYCFAIFSKCSYFLAASSSACLYSFSARSGKDSFREA